MNKKSPIEIFSEWVDNGKDDGMELNHCDSVNAMLNQVLNNANKYSFIAVSYTHLTLPTKA